VCVVVRQTVNIGRASERVCVCKSVCVIVQQKVCVFR